MGIMDIGLSTSRSSSESLAGVRIRPSGTQDVYVKWRTESGTDWNGSFDISVSWRAVPKGTSGTGESGYSYWSSFRWSNVPASSCSPLQTAGSDGWQWSYPLSGLGTLLDGTSDADGNDMGDILAPGGWSFGSRKYDAINLMVHIKSHYAEGMVDQWGRTESSRADADSLWVGYFPDYTLTAAYFSLRGFAVEYSVPGWTRKDDRWALESLTQGGEQLKVYNDYWAQVEEVGVLRVPNDALRRIPEAGQTVYVQVHMNAGFRDAGMDFGMVQGYVTVQDRSVCNTPQVAIVRADADSVVFAVYDSKDKGVPFDRAYVKLQGSPYSADVVEVSPGQTSSIKLPPLGVPIVLQCWGETDEAVSAVATATAGPVSGPDGLSLAAVDGSASVELRFNVSEDWSFEPEMETVKFAGRERDSVAYGVGGSVTGTLGCSIVDDESVGADCQRRADFEAMAFCGQCVLRGGDGERRVVAVESVGESWDTVRRLKTMSVSVREV